MAINNFSLQRRPVFFNNTHYKTLNPSPVVKPAVQQHLNRPLHKLITPVSPADRAIIATIQRSRQARAKIEHDARLRATATLAVKLVASYGAALMAMKSAHAAPGDNSAIFLALADKLQSASTSSQEPAHAFSKPIRKAHAKAARKGLEERQSRDPRSIKKQGNLRKYPVRTQPETRHVTQQATGYVGNKNVPPSYDWQEAPAAARAANGKQASYKNEPRESADAAEIRDLLAQLSAPAELAHPVQTAAASKSRPAARINTSKTSGTSASKPSARQQLRRVIREDQRSANELASLYRRPAASSALPALQVRANTGAMPGGPALPFGNDADWPPLPAPAQATTVAKSPAQSQARPLPWDRLPTSNAQGNAASLSPVRHARSAAGSACQIAPQGAGKKPDGWSDFKTIRDDAMAARSAQDDARTGLDGAAMKALFKLAFGAKLGASEFIKSFSPQAGERLKFSIADQADKYKKQRHVTLGKQARIDAFERVTQQGGALLARTQGWTRGGNAALALAGIMSGALQSAGEVNDYLALAPDSLQVAEETFKLGHKSAQWLGKHVSSARLVAFLAPASGFMQTIGSAAGKLGRLAGSVGLAFAIKHLHGLSKELAQDRLSEEQRALAITDAFFTSASLAVTGVAVSASVAGATTLAAVAGPVGVLIAAAGMTATYVGGLIAEGLESARRSAQMLVNRLDATRAALMTYRETEGDTAVYVTSSVVPIDRITPGAHAVVLRMDQSGTRSTQVRGGPDTWESQRHEVIMRQRGAAYVNQRYIIPFYSHSGVSQESRFTDLKTSEAIVLVHLIPGQRFEWTDGRTFGFTSDTEALVKLQNAYLHPDFDNRQGGHPAGVHIRDGHFVYYARTQTLDFKEGFNYATFPIPDDYKGKILLQANLDTRAGYLSSLSPSADVPVTINSLRGGNLDIFLNGEDAPDSFHADRYLHAQASGRTLDVKLERGQDAAEKTYLFQADEHSATFELGLVHNALTHAFKWDRDTQRWQTMAVTSNVATAPPSLQQLPGYGQAFPVGFPLPAGSVARKIADHSLWLIGETPPTAIDEAALERYLIVRPRGQDLDALDMALQALMQATGPVVLHDPGSSPGPYTQLTTTGLASRLLTSPEQDRYHRQLAYHAAQGKFLLRLALPALLDIDPTQGCTDRRITVTHAEISQWREKIRDERRSMNDLIFQTKTDGPGVRLTDKGEKEVFKLTRPDGAGKPDVLAVRELLKGAAHVAPVVQISWRDSIGERRSFYRSANGALIHAPFVEGASLDYLDAHEGFHYFARDDQPEALMRMPQIFGAIDPDTHTDTGTGIDTSAGVSAATAERLVVGDFLKTLQAEKGAFRIDPAHGPVWTGAQGNEIRGLAGLAGFSRDGIWQSRDGAQSRYWNAIDGRALSTRDQARFAALSAANDLRAIRLELLAHSLDRATSSLHDIGDLAFVPDWHSPLYRREVLDGGNGGDGGDGGGVTIRDAVKFYLPDTADSARLDAALHSAIDLYGLLAKNLQVKQGTAIFRMLGARAAQVGAEFSSHAEMLAAAQAAPAQAAQPGQSRQSAQSAPAAPAARAAQALASDPRNAKKSPLQGVARSPVLKLFSAEADKPVIWKFSAQNSLPAATIETPPNFEYMGMQNGHRLFYDKHEAGVVNTFADRATASALAANGVASIPASASAQTGSAPWLAVSAQQLQKLGMANAVPQGDALVAPDGTRLRRVIDASADQPSSLLELVRVTDDEPGFHYLDESTGKLFSLIDRYDDALDYLGKTPDGMHRLLHAPSQDIVRLGESGAELERSGFTCSQDGTTLTCHATDGDNYFAVPVSSAGQVIILEAGWDKVSVPARFKGALHLIFASEGMGDLRLDTLPEWTMQPPRREGQTLVARNTDGGEIHFTWADRAMLRLNEKAFSSMAALEQSLTVIPESTLSAEQAKALATDAVPFGSFFTGKTAFFYQRTDGLLDNQRFAYLEQRDFLWDESRGFIWRKLGKDAAEGNNDFADIVRSNGLSNTIFSIPHDGELSPSMPTSGHASPSMTGGLRDFHINDADPASWAVAEKYLTGVQLMGRVCALSIADDIASGKTWLLADASAAGNHLTLFRLDEINHYQVALGGGARLTIPASFLEIPSQQERDDTYVDINLRNLKPGDRTAIGIDLAQWDLSASSRQLDTLGRTIILCKNFGGHPSAGPGGDTDLDNNIRLILTPPAGARLKLMLRDQGDAGFIDIEVLGKAETSTSLAHARSLRSADTGCAGIPPPVKTKKAATAATAAAGASVAAATMREKAQHYSAVLDEVIQHGGEEQLFGKPDSSALPPTAEQRRINLLTMLSEADSAPGKRVLKYLKAMHAAKQRGMLEEIMSDFQLRQHAAHIITALDALYKKSREPDAPADVIAVVRSLQKKQSKTVPARVDFSKIPQAVMQFDPLALPLTRQDLLRIAHVDVRSHAVAWTMVMEPNGKRQFLLSVPDDPAFVPLKVELPDILMNGGDILATRRSVLAERANHLSAVLTRPGLPPEYFVSISGDQKENVKLGRYTFIGKPVPDGNDVIPVATGMNDRRSDTEAKFVHFVEALVAAHPDKDMTIDIYSSRACCSSCTLIIARYAREHPRIKINLWSDPLPQPVSHPVFDTLADGATA